jgi:hypothetical protein
MSAWKENRQAHEDAGHSWQCGPYKKGDNRVAVWVRTPDGDCYTYLAPEPVYDFTPFCGGRHLIDRAKIAKPNRGMTNA